MHVHLWVTTLWSLLTCLILTLTTTTTANPTRSRDRDNLYFLRAPADTDPSSSQEYMSSFEDELSPLGAPGMTAPRKDTRRSSLKHHRSANTTTHLKPSPGKSPQNVAPQVQKPADHDNQTYSETQTTTTPDFLANYTQKLLIPKPDKEDSYEQHYREKENDILKLVEMHGYGRAVEILIGQLAIKMKQQPTPEDYQHIRQSVITAVSDYHLALSAKLNSSIPSLEQPKGIEQSIVKTTKAPSPNSSKVPEAKAQGKTPGNSKYTGVFSDHDHSPAKLEPRQASNQSDSTSPNHPISTTHAPTHTTTTPHHTTIAPIKHKTTPRPKVWTTSRLKPLVAPTKEIKNIQTKREPSVRPTQATKVLTKKQAHSQPKPTTHAPVTTKGAHSTRAPVTIKTAHTTLAPSTIKTAHTTGAPKSVKAAASTRAPAATKKPASTHAPTTIKTKPTTHAPVAKGKLTTKVTIPPTTAKSTTTTKITTTSTTSTTPPTTETEEPSDISSGELFFPDSIETESPLWYDHTDNLSSDPNWYNTLDFSEPDLVYPNSTELEFPESNENSTPEVMEGEEVDAPEAATKSTFNVISTKSTSEMPIIIKNETTSSTVSSCPTFDDFLGTASKLWDRLLETTGFGNGFDLVVEAWIQSLKSLGSCFLSIASQVYAYFSGLLKSDDGSTIAAGEKGNGTSR